MRRSQEQLRHQHVQLCHLQVQSRQMQAQLCRMLAPTRQKQEHRASGTLSIFCDNRVGSSWELSLIASGLIGIWRLHPIPELFTQLTNFLLQPRNGLSFG
jgi:hypothetical protein